MLSRYDLIAVRKAKDVLWTRCERILRDELKLEKVRRRDTSSRTQVEADLDDVMDALEKLDGKQALPKIYCEADDLLQLPPAIPASSASVEIANLSEKIENLQNEVNRGLMEMNNNIKSLERAVPVQEDVPTHMRSLVPGSKVTI